MPQLIRTPEQIFREEGKDIYSIRFKAEGVDDDIFPSSQDELPARKEMLAWLKENVPNSCVESLATSEKSGFIVGYLDELRVDFSEADLATYCARWEIEGSESVDPRFQCYLRPYKDWLDEANKFIPTLERPTAPGLCQWWDTPIGTIHHWISMEKAAKQKLKRHPGNPKDIWHNAVRLWPELAPLKGSYGVTHGSTVKDNDEPWMLIYEPGGTVFKPHNFPPKRQKELLDWLRLPGDTRIIQDEW